MKKRIMTMFLSLCISISTFPYWVYGAVKSDFATREGVVELLVKSADDYNYGMKKEDILKEDFDENDEGLVTKAEALAMVSRAFGALPEPVGNNKRTGIQVPPFTDIPEWAREEIDNLYRAGVVLGNGEGLLYPNENVTLGEVNKIIKRIWALEGTNLKDDYYNSINKEELDNSVLAQGSPMYSTLGQLTDINYTRLYLILMDMIGKEYIKGSKEQKITDFYKTILDINSRNKQGIEPIQSYLDAIRKCEDVTQLIEVSQLIEKELGVNTLLYFHMTVDMKDSNHYIMEVSGESPSLTKENYKKESKKEKEAFIQYISTLYQLTGTTKPESDEKAQELYDFERAISLNRMDIEEYNDTDKIYNIYSAEEVDSLFSEVNIKQMIKTKGYSIPDKIVVTDPKLLEAYASYFTNENIDLLKNLLEMSLIIKTGNTLSEDFSKAASEYNHKILGTGGDELIDESATFTTISIMSDYFGELYVKKYFSEKSKKDIENMVYQFVEIYKKRIEKLDWMSDETKKMAIRKLDSLNVKIGYPDTWESYMDNIEIKSVDEGGSYFENYCTILKQINILDVNSQSMIVDKSRWGVNTYAANAYYNPSGNEIIFPAGILQAPFYDIKADVETNLGGIGMVIAHEITHAFDNNGAKYDENGNALDWWKPEDYIKFQALCDKVTEFYDGEEVAPGIELNGKLTLGENIADIGSIACILDAAAKIPHIDYKKLFESYAYCWRATYTREYLSLLSAVDVHSSNKLRVNKVLVNFDEFYSTYNITEDDGMYVAPEDRIKIW